MSKLLQLLAQALQKNHFTLDELTIKQLVEFLHLLQSWNKRFNLTSITDEHDMVYLHLIDSLVVQPYVQGFHCLDVGTGAGFPGIPLAIVDPKKKWVLLDKNNKKIAFLRQVVAELQLKNVEVVHGRCEDFQPPYCFDSILSRALGKLDDFIQMSTHLRCPKGVWIAMKGLYPDAELHDVPTQFKVSTVRIPIVGVDVMRHIVIISNECNQ